MYFTSKIGLSISGAFSSVKCAINFDTTHTKPLRLLKSLASLGPLDGFHNRRSIHGLSSDPNVCVAPKTTRQKSLAAPVNFLEMKPLKEYPIPDKIMALESSNLSETDFAW